MRIFSFGGGVQSTAVLCLAAKGALQYDAFVFANVGEDSEHPDALAYVRNVTMPFAERHALKLVEVAWARKDGSTDTLYKRIYRNQRSIPIPAHLQSGAPGNRACTSDFKIRNIDRWIAENGGKGHDVHIGLGISVDEIHRAKVKAPEAVRGFTKHLEYPLIDLHISRAQCHNIIAAAGLPPAPKSSCYFCPFHTHAAWIHLRNTRPDLFDKAVQLEKHINHKRQHTLGKDEVYLHSSLRPLDVAVGLQRTFLDELMNCESGYCFT